MSNLLLMRNLSAMLMNDLRVPFARIFSTNLGKPLVDIDFVKSVWKRS